MVLNQCPLINTHIKALNKHFLKEYKQFFQKTISKSLKIINKNNKMCMAPNPAKMSSTKIFVCPNKQKTHQLTVYSNEVSSSVENMMVLPVPSYNQSDIQFMDLSNNKNIFRILENATTMQTRGSDMSWSRPKSLKVHDVGSYKASIIPSLDEFKDLDKSVFSKDLPEEFLQILKKYYSENYVFIACILKTGSSEYHPFGYISPIINNQLFVPTRHVHNEHEETMSDWDHSIYFANYSSSKLTGSSYNGSTLFAQPYPKIYRQKDLDLNLNRDLFDYDIETLQKIIINGSYSNGDIVVY
jgi:hypothetical protein